MAEWNAVADDLEIGSYIAHAQSVEMLDGACFSLQENDAA